MYCELFKLKEAPFRLTPDPQFLYASKQHARAKSYMESSIWLADGFVVITGEIGSGKTTLIESFLEELPENVVLAHVNQTQLTPVEFLQALLVEFGFEPFQMAKVELMSILRDYMIEQYAAGKTLLLVIDEAQNLTREALEELRMLSGIEAQKEKLLRVVLAGQPELARQLDAPDLQQLKQRVRLQFHLGTLTRQETREYIEHRLEVAGAEGHEIITDDAFEPIFTYSGGVPRLINTLCDTAMLCGFAEEKSLIDTDLIMIAVEELQWVPFAQRYPTAIQSEAGQHANDYVDTGKHEKLHEPPAQFDVYYRDEPVSEYPLRLGRTIIGRTTDNDLQIASKFISRHHAQITTKMDVCTVEDLNSTNGVFIGTRRVKYHRLTDGDVIQLGEHKLIYRDNRESSGDIMPMRNATKPVRQEAYTSDDDPTG